MKFPGRCVGKGVVVEMLLRRVRLVLPSSSIVELHPVILSIFDVASVLESLCQEVPEIIVVGGVLETEIANIS